MLKISISNTIEQKNSGFIFGIICILVLSIGISLAYIQPGVVFTDGGIFTAVALKDIQSGTLYVNAWENKPPGIFYLLELAIWIFSDPVYAVFILSLSALVLSSVCIYILLYKNLKSLSASLFLSMVAVYFTLYKNNIGDGLYTEIYGCLCLLISMVLHTFYSEKKNVMFFYGAAFTMGMSFWFKEPFMFLCIPLCGLYFSKSQSTKQILLFIIYAALPSVFIVLVMGMQGSLTAYLDSVRYNLSYISSNETITLQVKINDVYIRLLQPAAGLFLLMAYTVYKLLQSKKNIWMAFWYIALWVASSAFVILSPHNFGHYYYPFFLFSFIALSGLYKAYNIPLNNELKWPLLLLSLFTMYRIDSTDRPRLKYTIDAYEPDRISLYLQKQKGKTLFVDYVVKSDYYIKSGLLYPTFLPVALPVHFGEEGKGPENRARIWKELSTSPPDFLITTYTTSYFSWFLPQTDFYQKNYHKIDSITTPGENILYIWKRNSP